MLLNNSRSESWNDFLTKDVIETLNGIEREIGENYAPEGNNVLRFMENDLDKIRICIIGQDPYYSVEKGELVANGRSFQPANLADWAEPYRQGSLKNIIRLIHKTYAQIEDYKDIKKYREIVLEIKSKEFDIKNPQEWFDSLEKQGVLFLNRYLTTEIGTPNAHREIWNVFGAEVFRYIDKMRPDMIWFLWGKEAIACSLYIENGTIYECRHPSRCSSKNEDDFLKSNCIEETRNIINWLG